MTHVYSCDSCHVCALSFAVTFSPPQKKLLVFVNPFSGPGKALLIFQQEVIPVFAEAGLLYHLFVTGNFETHYLLFFKEGAYLFYLF